MTPEENTHVYAVTDELFIIFINRGHAAVASRHNGTVDISDANGQIRVGAPAAKALEVAKGAAALLSEPSAIDVELLREALKHIDGMCAMYTFRREEDQPFGLMLVNDEKTVLIMPMHTHDAKLPLPCWGAKEQPNADQTA